MLRTPIYTSDAKTLTMRWPDLLTFKPHFPATAPLSLAVEQYTFDWTVFEALQVTEATGARRVYVELGCGSEKRSFQTVILEFDLATNTLVLERFCPRLGLRELFNAGRFNLVLDYLERPLTLSCIALGNCDQVYGGTLIKILDKGQQRLEADTPLRFSAVDAPSVEILIPMKGQSKSILSVITPHYMELHTLDRNALPAAGDVGECRIRFTEDFELQSPIKIKVVRKKRKPHMHHLFRASFLETTQGVGGEEVFTERLAAFLRILEQKQQPVHL